MKTVVTEGTPWAVVPIESLFEIVGGGTPDTKVSAYWNGEIPFATSADISDDGVSARRTVSESGVENSTTRIVPSGSVLVATRVGLGKVAVTTNRIAFSQDIQALVPKFDTNATVSRFVTDELRGIVAGFRQISRGTTIAGVTKNQVRELLLTIPPIEEQKRIVSTIDSLLSRIAAAEKELDRAEQLLTRLRQSLLTRAFDGSLTASWRQANETESADDLLARIKEEREAHYQTQLADWEARIATWERNGKEGKRPTKLRKPKDVEPLTAEELAELPRLPEAWRWVRLGTVSYGPEYGTSKKSNPEGSVPVLRMGNLQGGRIEWDDLQYTNDEDDIAQYRLKPGDVLFNRTNSPELVGKTARVVEDRLAVFAGYLVRVNQVSTIDASYLSHYLNSPFAKSIGAQVKTDGVNQSNINASKLMHYPFPLAPDTEQKEITRILDLEHYNSQITRKRIEQSYAYLKALRRSILQAAFSGRLTAKWRAEHPELISGENSAEALLARIKEESTT